MSVEITGGDIHFEIAIEERLGWDNDGGDTVIAGIPTGRVIDMVALEHTALRLAQKSAEDLGVSLRNGRFVLTSDPTVVRSFGILPEHAECAECIAGMEAAVRQLEDHPGRQVVLVGRLYWGRPPSS